MITEPRIKVFLVQQSLVVRDGMKEYLAQNGIEVTGEADNENDALDQYRANTTDVIIVSLYLKNGNGFNFISGIIKNDPAAKIIVYTFRGNQQLISEYYNAGAMGYVTKSSPICTLVDCIEQVSQDNVWYMPGISEQLAKFQSMIVSKTTKKSAQLIVERAGEQ